MSNLFLTLVLAFLVVVLALACLAISWLVTGKNRLRKGCGQSPTTSSSCQSKGSCSLCDKEEIPPPSTPSHS